ncbi:MAG: hypothetical protein EZS28_003127 [Streblomastix strix]|uniref:Uncharacterized protein n=1 Tax=Streblomastix strix TaxID=222440 RepID=A0A5J4X2T8_9EUKA|nr:MAG: hypothetical protein EZS28_003127 [Streblomastix strix]
MTPTAPQHDPKLISENPPQAMVSPCGTIEIPCQTIGNALLQVDNTTQWTILADNGNYVENLSDASLFRNKLIGHNVIFSGESILFSTFRSAISLGTTPIENIVVHLTQNSQFSANNATLVNENIERGVSTSKSNFHPFFLVESDCKLEINNCSVTFYKNTEQDAVASPFVLITVPSINHDIDPDNPTDPGNNPQDPDTPQDPDHTIQPINTLKYNTLLNYKHNNNNNKLNNNPSNQPDNDEIIPTVYIYNSNFSRLNYIQEDIIKSQFPHDFNSSSIYILIKHTQFTDISIRGGSIINCEDKGILQIQGWSFNNIQLIGEAYLNTLVKTYLSPSLVTSTNKEEILIFVIDNQIRELFMSSTADIITGSNKIGQASGIYKKGGCLCIGPTQIGNNNGVNDIGKNTEKLELFGVLRQNESNLFLASGAITAENCDSVVIRSIAFSNAYIGEIAFKATAMKEKQNYITSISRSIRFSVMMWDLQLEFNWKIRRNNY